MYSDEDLNHAVEQGIFERTAVTQFRLMVDQMHQSNAIDEENFRLLSGFNDVFVLIASALLLISLGWIGGTFSPPLGAASVALASWGLAEFFVKRRRMALPAIGLLVAFLGAVAAFPIVLTESPSGSYFIVSAILTVAAALVHWRRFRVPITVAAGTGAALAALVAAAFGYFPQIHHLFLPIMFGTGILTFCFAMYWDARDVTRQTRHADVAFWLHLLAAPLIVHPIFSSLGVLQGIDSTTTPFIVIGLYILLALVSITVDRRAIMVSALVYVVYAFSGLLENFGVVSLGFAITGTAIGATLLLLSAFWHTSRVKLLSCLPDSLRPYLPALKQA